jgi:hypothetical protein
MAIALDAGDGRIITQRQAGQSGDGSWTEADTVPLELRPDGTLATLFGGADWDGATVLHDIEVVNGRRLLLYSSQTPQVPQESNEDLYVADLDTGERMLVANGIGGWEFGTGRLHLATTGLIVGQRSSGPSWEPVFLPVPPPWGNGDFPLAADVGLDESYPDCACPSAFSISGDGTTLLWRSGTEPTILGTTLPDAPEAAALAVFPDGFVGDLDASQDVVLVSYAAIDGGPGQPALLVPRDGSAPIELPGEVATLSPAG